MTVGYLVEYAHACVKLRELSAREHQLRNRIFLCAGLVQNLIVALSDLVRAYKDVS